MAYPKRSSIERDCHLIIKEIDFVIFVGFFSYHNFQKQFSVVVFEQYQKARTTFAQTVAELASRPQNIETLQNAGIIIYSLGMNSMPSNMPNC